MSWEQPRRARGEATGRRREAAKQDRREGGEATGREGQETNRVQTTDTEARASKTGTAAATNPM